MSINLLDWRPLLLRRQLFQFLGLLSVLLLVTAALLGALHRYQQQLQHTLSRQQQQHTALRQGNQTLQQQLQQLQLQTTANDKQPHVISAAALDWLTTLLGRLPLNHGRLTAAELSAEPEQRLLSLHGYTRSAPEFERLKNHLEQQLPPDSRFELEQFDLNAERLEFAFRLTQPEPKGH
ncbi:hypothetical protein ACUHGC_11395 [Testudinibacter sp. P27/CKL/0425]